MIVPQSKQEWLDLMIKTSLEGGFPSLSEDGKLCRYRGAAGRKCTIGLLVDDADYGDGRVIEGQTAEDIVHFLPAWVNGDDADVVAGLMDVQEAHDISAADTAIVGESWDHGEFLNLLKGCQIFDGCKFPA